MVDISLYSNRYFEVLSRYRQKLLEKGANTIATLPRVFHSLPSYDGRSRVSEADFFGALERAGLHIIKEEAVLISRFIDREGSSMLDFEEFLFALRGTPNEVRQKTIDYVYHIFDKENRGEADANEMKKVFNCRKHPKFQMGKLSEDQMFYLYLKNFNNVVKMTVTKKEWDDYYAGLSIAIDNDDHFCRLLKEQFKVE